MTSLRTMGVDGKFTTPALHGCSAEDMAAALATDLAAGEVLVTDPTRGWIASVLPGEGPGGVDDVLIFSLDPADEWTPEYQRWAEAVESEFVVDPVAA
ncbi:hypothetical protein G4X40_06195 [Rhodococcus sp. D2-41]|uniref:Uncharacterized protein n=1 Tax=Speluncibacter jeojiensis TaxID=2710754 RepID=A0A9X4LY41_9ACTN|nr:hypothetical protein [Rhodococcus sp. D2-41]MDG3009735.1 hypothetical protein [Rhodococcus sp. D2-41]MDG3014484.1 hypothetical protein [Corynebacteriales bacterium D3-21]